MMRDRQRGVALITALVVVSIATIAATWLLVSLQQDIRRTGSVLHREQAWQYALGAEEWARHRLALDAKDNRYDGLDEDWAVELPPLPVEGGSISGRLVDLQGRLNLNALLTPEGRHDPVTLARLRRLLQQLELNPDLASAITDWIDADQEPTAPGGAEDGHYAALEPPYLAANRPMADPSELRLVAGIDEAAWQRLRPFVTALPQATPINVNTAPPEVLATLGIPLPEAERLAETLHDAPVERIEDFRLYPEVQEARVSDTGLAVTSQWFLLEVRVEIGQIRLDYRALLHRDEQGRIHTIQRSTGTA